MTVFCLPQEPVFPHPEFSDPDGLLAVGGDLSLERLIAAYSQGIFPWYGQNSPILWWSPDPRLVLFPEESHIPKSLRRIINAKRFKVTVNQAFEEVINWCARVKRKGQCGTWLVPEMIEAYIRLHEQGYAHSFEAWQEDRLVGGLYGVSLGRAFFGESMFHLISNASKVALVYMVQYLREHSFHFLDCQQTTAHMLRFGAREISRDEFLQRLKKALLKDEG